MAEYNAFNERRRGLEEEYFHRQEQELIAKLRRRAEASAERAAMMEQSGIADEELLDDLHALGFTRETVSLLHLAPLLEIAWAEGGVSDRERALILEAARARGIGADSAAGLQLADWLAVRPDDTVFDTALRAIRALLEGRSAADRAATAGDLVAHCEAIAAASGGILGFGKISPEEQALLRRISEELARRTAAG